MTISDPAQYIHSLGRFSGAPGLHRIRALLKKLGNPQNKLHFIHIAGTNGKGSTAAMLAAIAQRPFQHVGMFVSPYLVRFHERIQVDGKMIPEKQLSQLTQIVAEAANTLVLPDGETIGEFEFVFAVGLLYFVLHRCDLVVLETGLGGEFDATNSIGTPKVTVITPISFDHTAILGNSIKQIAGTKAGIIKKGSKVVCASGQPPEALNVIKTKCRALEVPLTIAQHAENIYCMLGASTFRYGNRTYWLNLTGRYQVENACTAIEAARLLGISYDNIRFGLQQVSFPGRLECVCEKPFTLLDGAHNPAGIKALGNAIQELLPDRRILLIMGMVQDKDISPCVSMLSQYAAAIYAVAPENERALPSSQLAALAAQGCDHVYDFGTLLPAYDAARQHAGPKDCILICGSLYLVGEAKKIFTARQEPSE